MIVVLFCKNLSSYFCYKHCIVLLNKGNLFLYLNGTSRNELFGASTTIPRIETWFFVMCGTLLCTLYIKGNMPYHFGYQETSDSENSLPSMGIISTIHLIFYEIVLSYLI